MRRLLILSVLALCLAGCSDDGAAPDDGFDVTVRVTDPAGDPVAGLEITLCSDNEFLLDKQAKPSVRIEFEAAEVADVLLSVVDVAGGHVRTLYDQSLPNPGAFVVQWVGDDDQGVQRPSGRYTARLVATVDGELVFEAERDLLMCLIGYLPVGVTDAAGRIVIDDRRHFPHLYPAVNQLLSTDEDASPRGLIELDETMRFGVHDPVGGTWMSFREEVSGDGDVVVLVWDPPAKAAAPAPAPTLLRDEDPPVLPPASWRLRPPYPNPFN